MPGTTLSFVLLSIPLSLGGWFIRPVTWHMDWELEMLWLQMNQHVRMEMHRPVILNHVDSIIIHNHVTGISLRQNRLAKKDHHANSTLPVFWDGSVFSILSASFSVL
jgi:hypothetical protein